MTWDRWDTVWLLVGVALVAHATWDLGKGRKW